MTARVIPIGAAEAHPDMSHVWQPAHLIKLLELAGKQPVRLITTLPAGESHLIAAFDGVVRDGEDPAGLTHDLLQLALAGLLARQLADNRPDRPAGEVAAQAFERARVIRQRNIRP